MSKIGNRFFNGISYNNGNTRSHFQSFTITTVKEISDYDGGVIFESVKDTQDYFDRTNIIGEPFYMVFAVFKTDHAESGMKVALLDNLSEAIRLVEMLTGNTIEEK
jgi:hypothetical protein